MAVVITAVILCIINIVLWIILAIRFKKIFSTEDIIDKTRTELNNMLIDVNRNTERNITLIDEKIKEMKSVTAEADRHLKITKNEYDKFITTQNLQQKIDKAKDSYSKINPVNQENVARLYKRNQSQGELFTNGQAEKKVEDSAVKIPVISPQIYMAEKPIEPEKSFNEIVKEKYDKGEDVEQIASELNRSTQEVEFALEISN